MPTIDTKFTNIRMTAAVTANMAGLAAPEPVAPWRHTVRLVAIFLVLSVAGFLWNGHHSSVSTIPVKHQSPIPFYVSAIASEWLLLFGVRAGVRSTGNSWRDLAGSTAFTKHGLIADVVIAVAVVAAWLAFSLFHPFHRATNSAGTVASLLPHGILEITLWMGVSISAGICEELAFRGYFQRQFTAWTKMRGAGLVLQALLFGVAHFYEGLQTSIAIAVFGATLGALVLWRKNLRAVAVAHVLADLMVGVLGK